MDTDLMGKIGAVGREVREREIEGRTARVVVATRTYETGISDLWDAITNPERIPRWFLPVTGELRLGGRYQLQGNAGGQVNECEPPERFAVTWEFGGGVSWVTVSLSALSAERTRLVLEHAAHVDDHWKKFGPGAVGVGWDLGLAGLELHLRGKAGVDPKEVEAWSASEQGKAFMRACSEGWGQAAIAAGEPREAALAAAASTAAFYTGEGATAG